MMSQDAAAPRAHRFLHDLFHRYINTNRPTVVPVSSHDDVPCPTTGRPLRVATVEAGSPAICPRCSSHGHGAFVSFVDDLRMAYACPSCREFVWLSGL